MALIVQSDAGAVALADSYQSRADLDAYATARGWSAWAAASADDRDQAAREATLYLDTVQRYKGIQLTAGQATEFPREGLVDWSGRTIAGIPAKVKRAHALLAFRALSESLYVDLDRGGKIAAESVAGISVSYQPDAPIGKIFREAMQLLAEYARDPQELHMPHGAEPAVDSYFSLGQHDVGNPS